MKFIEVGVELPVRKSGSDWKKVRDWICLSLDEKMKATDTGQTGPLLERRYGMMLVELCSKKTLQALIECVGERLLVERRHV